MTVNVLSDPTVQFAVELELLRINQLPKEKWPHPEDLMACPLCKGTGKSDSTKQQTACFHCLGKAWLPRRETLALTIASYGDDLQFGGPHCKMAFEALVNALVLLRLWTAGGEAERIDEQANAEYWALEGTLDKPLMKRIELALRNLI